LWAEVKQLYDQGLEEYVHDMWNLLDFTTNALYLATITLKAIAYFKVSMTKTLWDILILNGSPHPLIMG
jgi:transient receptor potential cation channel subfamily C